MNELFHRLETFLNTIFIPITLFVIRSQICLAFNTEEIHFYFYIIMYLHTFLLNIFVVFFLAENFHSWTAEAGFKQNHPEPKQFEVLPFIFALNPVVNSNPIAVPSYNNNCDLPTPFFKKQIKSQ